MKQRKKKMLEKALAVGVGRGLVESKVEAGGGT